MSLKGNGKYSNYRGKAFIYISSALMNDSQFPFEHNEKLNIEIIPKSNEIRIRKKSKESQVTL
jgi:hypothetical protein